MNIHLKSIRTINLPKKIIKNIIQIKNTHWKTTIKKQIKWFNSNVSKNDIHNFLYFNKILVGYNCLRYRKLEIHNKFFNYLLFDTIIIKKKYRKYGFGSTLMNLNNYIIKKTNLPAILLCENSKVKFYKKNSWKILKLNKKFIISFNKNKKIMAYQKSRIPSTRGKKIIFY